MESITFPFLGLRPYGDSEAGIFFGREKQIEQLLSFFDDSSDESKGFIAIVGRAGSGKSSLFNAGLLPKLNFQILKMRPQREPLNELLKVFYDDENGILQLTQEYLDAYDKKDKKYIQESLNTLFKEQKVFVIIDQFEELLSAYHRSTRLFDRDGLKQCECFSYILVNSIYIKNIAIVIMSRSEFIGEYDIFDGLTEIINNNLFLLPSLNEEQLQTAIEKPLELVAGDKIADSTLRRILKEISTEKYPLPVIQHTLLRMWLQARSKRQGQSFERQYITLNHKDYEDIGTLSGAINQHADEIYKELTEKQKKLCRGIFQCITERTISKNYVVNARHPMRLANIAEILQATEQELIEIIEYFNDYTCGFITPLRRSEQKIISDTVIDISHESLISHWTRLKEWVEEEAENANMYKLLLNDARHWKFEKRNTIWKGGKLVDAVKWLNDYKPSDEWARKYEIQEDYDTTVKSNLPLVKEFVRYGQLKEQLSNATWTIVLLLVLMSSVALYYQQSLYEQEQTHKNQIQITSHLINTRILTQKDNYTQAQQELTKLQQVDKQYISSTQQHTANLFNWYNSQLMTTRPIHSVELPKPMYNLYFDEASQLLIAGGENAKLLFYDKNMQLKQLPFADSIVGINKDINTITSYQNSIFIAVYEGETENNPEQTTIYQLNTPVTENSQLIPISTVKGSTLGMAVHQNTLAYTDKNNNIILFDLETKQEIKQLQGHQETIFDLKFNPQATLLASASGDNTVRLWNLSNNQSQTLIGHQEPVFRVKFNHQGNLLASASFDKTVQLWDVKNPQVAQQTLQEHKAAVLSIAFSQDDKFLISASKDRTLHIWDVQSGKTLRVLEGHQGQVNALALVDKHIYSVGGDSQLNQWDLALGMQWIPLAQAKSVSLQNQSIAVGFQNGKLAMYELNNFDKPLWQITAHETAIKRIQFNPQGNLLATLDKKDTLKLWQTATGTLIQSIEQPARDMAFSNDNQYLAFASHDGEMGLFSLNDKTVQTYKNSIDSDLETIAFHPNNNELATSGRYSDVYIWRIKNGQFALHQQIKDVPKQIDDLNYSQDGQQLAVVGANPTMPYFYDTVHYNKQIPTGDGHTETIAKVIFAPNHQHIATLGTDNTIRFWNLNHELFTIRLPLRDKFSSGYDIDDFDFQCADNGQCWIATPLAGKKLALYDLGIIY